ncbi:hypothetical protein OS190_05990 [Sulfitobacter sp. F26204]|uniref:hypothetical protein n=1 Tax=Sulfitobacter sp. F26204 TaxID=2996014 RepID=UPI00225DFC2C|nr:hypothetical protein [Sulfitobacter sp. F26204]MCX7559112.1 hypothetical protein [Sulfitobacter sp. F26204]
MTALIKDRNTLQRLGDNMLGPMASGETVFVGAMLLRRGDGFLTIGQPVVGAVGVGIAMAAIADTGAANGTTKGEYQAGTFLLANSAAADLIATADIGAVCYAVDDQTVAKTDGTGTRSVAGFIADVEPRGVWVRFDEAMARNL